MTVFKVSGRTVSIAVDAPRFLRISRNEIFSKEKSIPINQQIAVAIVDCLAMNGIEMDAEKTQVICDLCNCVFESVAFQAVAGGLSHAS